MRAPALAIALVFAALPAAAQDAKLVGQWDAVDQPGKWIEFRADGEFHYIYDLGPPRTRLVLQWKTGWFSSLTLSSGGSARSCKYSLNGDTLTIDDGSGHSCIDNRPVNMAKTFRRAPADKSRGDGGLHFDSRTR